MGRKLGPVPLFNVGTASPSNPVWPGPRPISILCRILIRATVWPQYNNITDRQDKQTGRHTDNGPIAYGEPFCRRSPKNVGSTIGEVKWANGCWKGYTLPTRRNVEPGKLCRAFQLRLEAASFMPVNSPDLSQFHERFLTEAKITLPPLRVGEVRPGAVATSHFLRDVPRTHHTTVSKL